MADAARRSVTVGPSIGKLLKTGDERLHAEASTLMPAALPALPFRHFSTLAVGTQSEEAGLVANADPDKLIRCLGTFVQLAHQNYARDG